MCLVHMWKQRPMKPGVMCQRTHSQGVTEQDSEPGMCDPSTFPLLGESLGMCLNKAWMRSPSQKHQELRLASASGLLSWGPGVMGRESTQGSPTSQRLGIREGRAEGRLRKQSHTSHCFANPG